MISVNVGIMGVMDVSVGVREMEFTGWLLGLVDWGFSELQDDGIAFGQCPVM